MRKIYLTELEVFDHDIAKRILPVPAPRLTPARRCGILKTKEMQAMIRIYGMPTCPYCDYVHEQIKGREDEFEYINIGENIRNMSAFTRLRDTDPVFDRLKAIGDVGIPAFVFEDGRVSVDPADAGLIEYGSANACSLEDHKSGRKGC